MREAVVNQLEVPSTAEGKSCELFEKGEYVITSGDPREGRFVETAFHEGLRLSSAEFASIDPNSTRGRTYMGGGRRAARGPRAATRVRQQRTAFDHDTSVFMVL